jgi:hypothetical protein
MSSQWHYSKDGSQHGPVTSQRLRELSASGDLEPNDLIWKEGLADWRPAMSLKGLFPEPAKPSGPPPLPPNATPTSRSATPPMAEGPAPATVRKPDFFDKARELAQRATETVGQGQGRGVSEGGPGKVRQDGRESAGAARAPCSAGNGGKHQLFCHSPGESATDRAGGDSFDARR